MALSDNFVAKYDQLLKHLGIEIIEAAPAYAVARMPLDSHHLNYWGAAHGGAIAALVDAAFGAAANDGRVTSVVTLSTTIEYLRPGFKGPLTAEASAIRSGRHVLNYEITVRDASDIQVARALVNGYVTDFPMPPKQEARDESKKNP